MMDFPQRISSPPVHNLFKGSYERQTQSGSNSRLLNQLGKCSTTDNTQQD